MKFYKNLLIASLFALLFTSCSEMPVTYNSYDDYPAYNGKDLGLSYTPQKSTLKVWSPAVESMQVHLYKDGHTDSKIESKPMKRSSDGVWSIELEGDQKGVYYTFQVTNEGKQMDEVPDPYAKACGLNGQRAMIVDLNATNPTGWENDTRPALNKFTDILIYELHVKDMSSHPSSNINVRGKFIGLVESGTKNPDGLTTGLDHFKELGVTHVHLLPSFDFMGRSVDESKADEQFNWGYDPQNYNIPEGAYSTDPYNGAVRIKEFKEMVKAFHENGIRVVLDVVYNHTGVTEESNFNQIAPGYYYRHNEDGSFANASACGNETASERPMMRKFMIESMKYWVEEYHLDGFRVDLMGIHDIETMNLIDDELKKIDPTIFVYGEGWTAGDSPLAFEERSLKAHAPKFKTIAAFSDDIRDGLKGSVFEHADRGFASGKEGMKASVQFGVVGATQHPQIDYPAVNYSDAFWANNPTQCINYVSCHDNHTLYDKLLISTKKDGKERPDEELLRMHKLANTIVLTSQGVPFLHAGVEIARTKNGEENSYKSSDAINQIDWNRKTKFKEHFEYYKALIQLRKNHPAFRMPTTEMVTQHLKFLPIEDTSIVGYHISGNANGDSWKNILVLFNGSEEKKSVNIPKGSWKVVLENHRINEGGIRTQQQAILNMNGTSATILVQE